MSTEVQTTQMANEPFELHAILEQISKPGMIFGEPIRDGKRIIIPSSRWVVKKGLVTVRPYSLIIISPNGVKVQPMRKNPIVSIIWGGLLLAILGTIPVIYAPPWRPEFNLFEEIGKLFGHQQ